MSWLDKYEQGGIIEDDRGQWAHPGKITKINSNNITMKGVDYPVLGISNTGDQKLMQPGKDYKFEGKSVTEYPMAQKGLQVEADKTIDYFKEYHKSPRYNQMLKESAGDDYKSIKDDRDWNLHLIDRYKTRGGIKYTDNLPTFFGDDKVLGTSNSWTGNISLNPDVELNDLRELVTHEVGHSIDRPAGLWDKVFYNREIPDKDIRKIKQWSPKKTEETSLYINGTLEQRGAANRLFTPEKLEYYTNPTEVRARLNAVRRWAKEQKIYDPFTEKMDKEALHKIWGDKNRTPDFKDLINTYDSSRLLEMFNTISQNKSPLDKSNKSSNFTSPNNWLDKYSTTS